MIKKTALITGITGQDGSYLAELLLAKGYRVVGTIRRSSNFLISRSWLNHLIDYIDLEYVDVTDLSSIISIIRKYRPDEIYNLAAQSHVRVSFDNPIYTANVTAIGALNVFEAVRLVDQGIKVYQASSSEMFGNNADDDGFQRETTPMNPVSPYGCSKLFAYNIANNYKNSYNMFISNGILFNHESPRRGLNFVTNKIVANAVDIKKGYKSELALGNLNATRDWGHAKDYVRAMWEIMQLDYPNNFVCATGISHSVLDVVKYVFNSLDLNYESYIEVENKYKRPEELHNLKGDATKLLNYTNWKPEYNFESMLDDMIKYRLEIK